MGTAGTEHPTLPEISSSRLCRGTEVSQLREDEVPGLEVNLSSLTGKVLLYCAMAKTRGLQQE